MLTIGKPAPAFALLNQDEQQVELADQHLKISPADSVARAVAFLQGGA